MLHYRNRAIEELAGRVAEKLNKPRGSGYVERCRDYIQKHYREKIYLEDISEALGLSPTYLSRLFKKRPGSVSRTLSTKSGSFVPPISCCIPSCP